MQYAVVSIVSKFTHHSYLYSELCGFHYVVISECVNKTAVLDTMHLKSSALWQDVMMYISVCPH